MPNRLALLLQQVIGAVVLLMLQPQVMLKDQ